MAKGTNSFFNSHFEFLSCVELNHDLTNIVTIIIPQRTWRKSCFFALSCTWMHMCFFVRVLVVCNAREVVRKHNSYIMYRWDVLHHYNVIGSFGEGIFARILPAHQITISSTVRVFCGRFFLLFFQKDDFNSVVQLLQFSATLVITVRDYWHFCASCITLTHTHAFIVLILNHLYAMDVVGIGNWCCRFEFIIELWPS